MNRTLAAALMTGILTATPSAQADPRRHYDGGCAFLTVDDTLPTEPLGGQDQWTGEADAEVIAHAPAAPISFRCDLWRNGTTNLGTVLSGSGIGVASDTDLTFTFTAGSTDVVSVCEQVTVAGEQHGSATVFDPAWCTDSTTTPIVPDPAQEALVTAIDLLNDFVFGPRSYTLCPGLAAVATVVNAIDPSVVAIDPFSGSTDLFETDFWTCPPHAFARAAEQYKVHATCRYKDGKITGSATAYGQAGATTTRIRCVGREPDNDIVFDEDMLAPGDQATLAGTVESEPDTLCATGTANWDGEPAVVAENCTRSAGAVRPPRMPSVNT